MQDIKLKGKTYKLKFGANAYAKFEQETGLTTSEAMTLAQNRGLSFNVIRGLIWAGLLHINEDLRIESVGSLMECNPNSLLDYMEVVSKAIGKSMGGEQAIAQGIKRAKQELGDDVFLRELDNAGEGEKPLQAKPEGITGESTG